MAKLTFVYGTMNSGKSLELISIHHNYISNNKKVLLLKPKIDDRNGENIIKSRALDAKLEAISLDKHSNILLQVINNNDINIILVDEVQFLTIHQIDELFEVSKIFNIPVMCFGLKSDFQARLFPAIAKLFVLADEIREVKTLCGECGEHVAKFNIRYIDNKPTFVGDQIVIGDSNYKPVCSNCYIKLRRVYDFNK